MILSYRPYDPSDRNTCIEVFQTNNPRYFRDFELNGFLEFLDSKASEYFMVFADEEVVGCGGYDFRDSEDTGVLCWGMVRQDQHGKRLGEYLLLIRLKALADDPKVKFVKLSTCQLTEGFFEKYGFEIQSTKQDGIAAGLDEVEMQLEMSDQRREMIEREWGRVAS